MKTTTRTPNALDRLTDTCTAFRTWNDLLAALRRGYVPTLNGGRSFAKLADVIRRNGYRVFRLGRVA